MPENSKYMGRSRDVAVGAPPMPPKLASKEHERAFLKFRLAQAYRLFGKLGYDEGVAGHITVRDSIRTDCFWVNPFGKHFSMIQPEDLILVNHGAEVQVEESGPNVLLNKAAFMIHGAIHEARPDVHCAAHSHSIYGRAFSTLGKELSMITQDSCAFYEDHALYDQYGGLVLGEEEGEHIAKALGKKKAAILQNHGLLVATDSIEATVHFFMTMEKSCQVQLAAEAAAAGTGRKPIEIPAAEAAAVYKVTGSNYGGWFSGRPHFELLEHLEGEKFDFERGEVVKVAKP
ncbi:class II aldolase/adducin domain-containing protein [Trametes versicolor FP-101664 SS1]|uniref:class II aldolase/adducin domain-containing protein n=1 Tax=Trametes versicolor (strain FP-101664) TaxID=717944 RepID=UPI0004624792|nr:class II aldolase/adducin domain-containing protein [Trametes versicolor FP-101664 SS1]EIW60087.1 class II aldolase/adducin domain-containing protein [Trametes versicolor FP-101664 SS1]